MQHLLLSLSKCIPSRGNRISLMDFVTDLHLHSQYSMAVSKDMTLPIMSSVARQKGIDILSTGDWTHPMWFAELKQQLVQSHEGLFMLKNSTKTPHTQHFILSTEISCIFTQNGKAHRMHNLVVSPSFETCEKVNQALAKRGCNVASDGRPIIGLSSKQLLQLVLEIDERCLLIPCHIWTPWFSLFGAHSGFESFTDCFEEMSAYVYGIETGLDSDPQMNWQVKDLENKTLLSFSDAHSPMKMGREATVFRLQSPSFTNIREAIMSQALRSHGKTPHNTVGFTIEFYPEEGKYHYTGHRKCGVYQTPEETRQQGTLCPVCKRKLTVGVLAQVEALSTQSVRGTIEEKDFGMQWISDPKKERPPFVKIVPLNEIIAESLGFGVGSKRVKSLYQSICLKLGSELDILLKTDIATIALFAGERIAEGIEKVRRGDLMIQPGFDNEYGKVRIWEKSEEIERKKIQLGIDF